MSQESLEIVRRGYEAFARGDTESLAALFRDHLDPGFEYQSQLAGETFRGVAGALAFVAGVREAFQGYTLEIEDIVDSGEHVLVTSRQWGRGAGSGLPIDWRIRIVWTFDDDGRAVSGRAFSSQTDALEAAGLRSRWASWEHRTGRVKDGDYTLVEDRDPGPRGLAVRRVSEAERRMVWRWGGFLFATAEDAEQFARCRLIFENGPQVARQAFSHKRVDGRRIYVHQGSGGGV